MDKPKIFDVICFTADTRRYFPASIGKQNWMTDNFIKHTEIDINLGQSRYGGPIIDLPENIDVPLNLRFAAQLDLAKFSPIDKTGLLPKTGQLIFFADIRNNTGKVIYSAAPSDKLKRHIVEHEDNFFDGVLIDTVYAGTETFEERFIKSDGNDNTWDDFAGSEKSKIFGVYTTYNMAKAGGQFRTEQNIKLYPHSNISTLAPGTSLATLTKISNNGICKM
ncbi:YwqG family protein [Flavitalea sp.]|nr:hypothetical protein [Flavitalea sp.]